MNHELRIREAILEDIAELQVIRHAVKENILSDPSLVTDADCARYLTTDGKGWVCEAGNVITGFAIIDTTRNNIWALFMRPEYEKNGIGKQLHNKMLSWHFNQSRETLWLGTAPDTRAETFYRMQGWKECGLHGKEIKFELSYDDWSKHQH